MKLDKSFWRATFVTSIVIHTFFGALYTSAMVGGIALGKLFSVVFYAQLVSMVLLCPDTMWFYDYGGSEKTLAETIGWIRYVKWLIAAYPASSVYGILCINLWNYNRRLRS